MDVNERWYEDKQTAANSSHSTTVSSQHLAQAPYADLEESIFDDLQRPLPAIHHSFTKKAEKTSSRSRQCKRKLMPESSLDVPTPILNRSPLLSSQQNLKEIHF